ncbi:hypothetical protein MLD38_004490 [Melastoma candidum]|uniref:Uncharacterized protein n=1 Tax=Melastoma candidum TaxID=119954 RepID=A0ACB9S762_9MYRT|nr:hypothetical protein MLD38_004490 [Melastoma candidum]
MDDLGVHGRVVARKKLSPAKNTTAKHDKRGKKPVKVVYISNPMRVSTSASSFRDLVHRLTGQDSEFPDEPMTFHAGLESSGGDPVTYQELCPGHDQDRWGGTAVHVAGGGPMGEVPGLEELAEEEEGFISPRMLESLSEFLPPSLFVEHTS